ncbi:MAG: aspartate aminotransferase family protein [Actinobacteria bacterium]|nr:aspartate aminotransferase family protein [Actinomycetota bacterium]
MTYVPFEWKALESAYYHQVFRRAPVTLVRGEGTRVWDETGREFLDFVAGIAVNTLGHAHPELTSAITAQARTLLHTSNLFYTVPQLEVAMRLVAHSSLDRVFFVNSGAEATETCIKVARKYGKLQRGGAYEIITTARSFHGRTLATTAATGTRAYQEPFDPMPQGFVQVPYNDLDAMEDAITDKTVALMVELVQAEGGVWPADPAYALGLRELCDARGLLLILDEVQTGIGRTGRLFAYEHYLIRPDLMALAKGLGGGLPIGAALSTERCSVLKPGDHGSTFSGNPLVCTAARVTLDHVLAPGFLEQVRMKGAMTVRRLREMGATTGRITDVRGLGLLVGFDLETTELADRIVAYARDHGLLIIKVAANTIRLVPPLNVTPPEIDQALDIIESALRA